MGKVTKKAKIARFFNEYPAATIREAATATDASYGMAWTVRKDLEAIADDVLGIPSHKTFNKWLKRDDETRYKEPAPIGWTNDDETQQSEKVLVDASLVRHWESIIRESAEQARKGRTQEQIEAHLESMMQVSEGTSDGSTASYYELPDGAAELQDLISHKDMNAQIGEIFRAAYRYGESSHSDELRDAKKIRFYIDAEIKRLGG